MRYRGAVNYYVNLPANPVQGDVWVVRYQGTSGRVPNGHAYCWENAPISSDKTYIGDVPAYTHLINLQPDIVTWLTGKENKGLAWVGFTTNTGTIFIVPSNAAIPQGAERNNFLYPPVFKPANNSNFYLRKSDCSSGSWNQDIRAFNFRRYRTSDGFFIHALRYDDPTQTVSDTALNRQSQYDVTINGITYKGYSTVTPRYITNLPINPPDYTMWYDTYYKYSTGCVYWDFESASSSDPCGNFISNRILFDTNGDIVAPGPNTYTLCYAGAEMETQWVDLGAIGQDLPTDKGVIYYNGICYSSGGGGSGEYFSKTQIDIGKSNLRSLYNSTLNIPSDVDFINNLIFLEGNNVSISGNNLDIYGNFINTRGGNLSFTSSLYSNFIFGESHIINARSLTEALIFGRSNEIRDYDSQLNSDLYSPILIGDYNIISGSSEFSSSNTAYALIGSYNKIGIASGDWLACYGLYAFGNRNELSGYENYIIGYGNKNSGSKYSTNMGIDNLIGGSSYSYSIGYYNKIQGSSNISCVGLYNDITSSEDGYIFGYRNTFSNSRDVYIFGEIGNISSSLTESIRLGFYPLDNSDFFAIGDGSSSANRSSIIRIDSSKNIYLNSTVPIPPIPTTNGTYSLNVLNGASSWIVGGGGGSTVIANPSGAATDSLTKISIDNVIYSLSGSGTYVEANPSGTGSTDLISVEIGSTIYNIPQGVNVVANPSGTASTDLNSLEVGSTIYSIPQGTNVTANPAASATDTLTKLEVGSTVYSVSGGSSTLSGLSDVAITDPTDGQVLTYDGTAQKWKNKGAGNTGTVLTGTLTAGSTTLTFSNAAITATSTIDLYTDVFGVDPTNISTSTGSVTLTFEAQASDVSVKIIVDGGKEESTYTYSTSEQVIGKWLDGSNVYERTYVFTSADMNGTWSISGGFGTLFYLPYGDEISKIWIDVGSSFVYSSTDASISQTITFPVTVGGTGSSYVRSCIQRNPSVNNGKMVVNFQATFPSDIDSIKNSLAYIFTFRYTKVS